MQFVFPAFLIALAAIAIPIIIHLFYFRRFKKVYFTNTRFLREVKEETSARSRLRNLLVLLMRCLAVILLVFAFAQPFLKRSSEVKLGEKSVSIFIDNSFSMNALSEDVPLLTLAKDRARSIVQAYGAGDRFQVLTNDFEGRHQRLLSQEDALGLIDEIAPTPSVREMSEVLERQQQTLESGTSETMVSFVVSDFQQNITDLQTWMDTSMEVNLVPLQSVRQENISIDTAWFESPVQMLNQNSRLFVRVRNWSDEPAENIRLSFRHEGQLKPVGSFNIPARGAVLDTVNVPILRTGWHEAELTITDYPVLFDDNYLLTFPVAEEISVLEIFGSAPDPALASVFNGIGYFSLDTRSASNLDYSSFSGYQMIVLHGQSTLSSGLSFELQQYLQNGGNVLLFPSRTADLSSYNSFLQSVAANEFQSFSEAVRQGVSLNTEAFVFRDVFENPDDNLKLPQTLGNFPITRYGSRAEESLITYRDGSTFLGKYSVEQGHFFLCSAPLSADFNDLVRSGEVFVPMLYRMALSSGKTRKVAYVIGLDEVIEVANTLADAETVFKISGADKEFIPEQRNLGPKTVLSVHTQIEEADYYDLFLEVGKPLDRYAFNYDRRESDLSYFTTGDLADLLPTEKMSIVDAEVRADFGALIGERNQGVALWRWAIVLALLFLALEVLLLRFWKV